MSDVVKTLIMDEETDEFVERLVDGSVIISDDAVRTSLTIDSSGILHSQKGSDPAKEYATTGGGLDTTAIHVDEADEISGITEKTVLSDTDLIVIEDSEASNVKKKVQVSNIPLGDIDGGSASSVYLVSQTLDGGGA